MATISQKLLDDLTNIIPTLTIHIAGDSDLQEKMLAMYKILVTGNGSPPLPEVVRIHSAWIIAHDALVLQIEARKEDILKESRMFRRQLIILFFGQAITIIGLIISFIK